jgi:hypothetical protein
MKNINHKQSLAEEFWFACHAIWLKGAGEIINDDAGGGFPPRIEGREYVIASLSRRYAMKAITNTVRTPYAHDATCETALSVFCIELVAAFATLLLVGLVTARVIGKRGVRRPVANGWQSVTSACLILELEIWMIKEFKSE